MIRSKVLQLTVATALLAGAQSAMACSTSAWSSAQGGVTAGEPALATPTATSFRRWSGRCGLKAASVGQFVVDNSPNSETTFKARGYFYSGGLTGQARIFEGRNTAGTPVITVTYDATAGQLVFGAQGTASTVNAPAAANRWHGFEVRWAAAGGLTALVGGTSITGTAITPPTTVTLAGSSGGEISSAAFGWISGGALTGNQPNFDEYDSRRTSDIGFLCPGNAQNTNTVINLADRTVIQNNILNSALASGQADADGSGAVALADRTIIQNIILAGTTVANNFCNGAN